MRIFITGGAGYIGSVVCRRLISEGHFVCAYDSFLFGRESIEELIGNPLFECIEGDITDEKKLLKAMIGFDAVVHLAAIVGDKACAEQKDKSFEVNGIGAILVFETALKCGVKHFIFSSTCSNYGVMESEDELLDENSDLLPQSVYATQKVSFEKYLMAETPKNTAITILRFATAYGLSPRMRFDLTVNHFTRDLALGKTLEVFGADLWRPYCHIRDFAKAISLVLNKKNNEETLVLNIGDSDENYTKRKIADCILKEIPNGKVEYKDSVGSDVRNYRVDFSKAKKELNFTIDFRVPDGISEIHNAIKEGLFSDPLPSKYINA